MEQNEYDENQNYVWVENTVKSKKPYMEKGFISIKDVLQYLVRVIPQDHPIFDYILTLASFATQHKLSGKQIAEIKKIIDYYYKTWVL